MGTRREIWTMADDGDFDEEVRGQVKRMKTKADLKKLIKKARPASWFGKGKIINVDDKMQSGYSYELEENPGEGFADQFEPDYTPAEMLAEGVFEGKYLNAFQIKSRKPLEHWKAKGWIPCVDDDPDVRGWFQWYCRYYMGRRIPTVDKRQIGRWRSFRRHAGQVRASYKRMEPSDRPTTKEEKMQHRAKQRQGLLQWAYDPWI